MLGCSAAHNLASSASRREFLRQLDHAAIFLMIAGTYTPFTTCRLHGVWAIGMTAAVWTGALTGAVIKLICPSRIERVSIVAYLGLGWGVVGQERIVSGQRGSLRSSEREAPNVPVHQPPDREDDKDQSEYAADPDGSALTVIAAAVEPKPASKEDHEQQNDQN